MQLVCSSTSAAITRMAETRPSAATPVVPVDEGAETDLKKLLTADPFQAE